MSNYDREQREMEGVQQDLRLGMVLEVTGWVLLAFVAIPAFFVWTGWRVGSLFWVYWTVIEGVIGLALTGAGQYYKSRAGTHVSRSGEERKAA